MAGINNSTAGTGPLSTFKAATIATTPAADLGQGNGGTGALTADANQARGGIGQLQAAAGGLEAFQANVPVLFQDKTPTNGGSSIQPFQAADIDQFGKSNKGGATGGDAQSGGTIAQVVNSLPPAIQSFVAPVARLFLGQNQNFSSVGDPHETTGDGLKFDNELTGKFIAFRSDEGDLELQKDQGPDQSGRWPGMTLNHAVAMKVGANTISFDISNTLKINGKNVPMSNGTTTLPDGTTVAISGRSISVTSPRGDVINVANQDQYLDVSGTISGNRPTDSVEGSLGDFHSGGDTTKDLVTRNGSAVGLDQLSTFLNSWRVPQSESLF